MIAPRWQAVIDEYRIPSAWTVRLDHSFYGAAINLTQPQAVRLAQMLNDCDMSMDFGSAAAKPTSVSTARRIRVYELFRLQEGIELEDYLGKQAWRPEQFEERKRCYQTALAASPWEVKP